MDESFDQPNLCLARPESSCEYSRSSDGSLDTSLPADFLSADSMDDYMTENQDFVFDDNNNIDYTRIEMC